MGIARTKSNESSQRVEAGHPHEAKRENRNSLRKHKGMSKKIEKGHELLPNEEITAAVTEDCEENQNRENDPQEEQKKSLARKKT